MRLRAMGSGFAPRNSGEEAWIGAVTCQGSSRQVFRRLFCQLSTCGLIWLLATVMLCRAQVVTQDEKRLLNTPASLRCSLQNPEEVLIVTWQKVKPVSLENMVTFSKNHGVVVQPAYKDKINVTQLELKNSTITFWNTTLEDEGCYKCLFNTFGSGKISGTACLTLSVQPTVFLHYNFFEDQLNITCFANARPAPVISWKVAGSGIENSTEVLLHPNGTTSVTSVLHVKDPKRQVGKEVVCQVLHLGTVTSLRQTVDKGFWFSVPLLLSIVSLVILLVLISILLYWKRRRNQDRDFELWDCYTSSFGHLSQDYFERNRESTSGGEEGEACSPLSRKPEQSPGILTPVEGRCSNNRATLGSLILAVLSPAQPHGIRDQNKV